ncbi:MAG: hypothetical protein IID46_06540, partial [Planctomycetes bacterium]|nr:hypothetical protein [Planctomycetota bacterium]
MGGTQHSADTLANVNSKISDATLDDSGDPRDPNAHVHNASDVNAGTLADARIAQSNVTQHQGAIDHDALLNYLIAQHRIINDAGSSTTELYSASKIASEIAAVVAGVDHKDPVATSTEGVGNITLSGEQTLNGLLTSGSRILVMEQTAGQDNGIYITDAGAWSRSPDADDDDEVTNGLTIWVDGPASTVFRHNYLFTTPDPITVGTTPLTFAQ